MPKLIIEFQGQEWTVDLHEGSALIGRAATCTIPIKDPNLSREHCEIRLTGSVATALDRGSMNGTVVNGIRIQEHRLEPGDKITIGHLTIWYEAKKAASQAPPAPADARAGTRRAVTEEAPPAAPPEGIPPDYVLSGRIVMPWRKLFFGIVVLAVLGALALAAREFGGGDAGDRRDPNNLLKRNPFFEMSDEGRPVAWILRGSEKGKLSVAPQGKTGSCLSLEKAAGAGDLVLECAYAEDIALGRNAGVDVSAWARYDGFGGWAAVKIDWLRSVNGPAVAEDLSPPAPRGSGWNPLEASFTAPAGAGAFRVSLAAVGRSGRLSFDDVSVRFRAQGMPGREHKLGPYRVAAGREGTLQVETRGRRSLINFHARLESLREGSLTQAAARKVETAVGEDQISFKGRMASPADLLREIDFEEVVAHKADELAVQYGFPGSGLRQVDRISLVFTIPRVDRIREVPDAPDKTTNRISFRSEEGEIVVEYSESVYVRVEQVRGGLRVVQSFPVDPSDEDPVFALKIREAALGAGGDPLAIASGLALREKMGEALAVLREEFRKVKDPVRRDRVEGDIRRLEEIERREWAEIQVAAFQAVLSRRADLVNSGVEALDRYQRRWTGESFASKADEVRERLREVMAGVAETEAGFHKLVVERARRHAAEGRKAMARLMVRALLARHPESAAAEEAQEFLQSLSEP